MLGQTVRAGSTQPWAAVGYLMETPHAWTELAGRENLAAVRRYCRAAGTARGDAGGRGYLAPMSTAILLRIMAQVVAAAGRAGTRADGPVSCALVILTALAEIRGYAGLVGVGGSDQPTRINPIYHSWT